MTTRAAATAATISTTDVAVGEWTIRTHLAGDPADPAILWLHGSGPGVSALSNWQTLITTMPGYRHIAPDVLGFGDSSHPHDLPLGVAGSAAMRAQAMSGLLDALGVPKAHLVGNSMGGMISLLMLQAEPERFDRVILMGSGGAPMTPTPDLIAMITYYDRAGDDAMRDLIGRFVFDTGLFGDEIGAIAADRAAVAGRDDVRRSHLRTFSPEGPPLVFAEKELARITHEVLLVHGREDRIIPKQATFYLADALPNAQLHVLPHAGHWVQIEQTERFRALAQQFLAGTADGGAA
ncbi:MAG: alpha/beta fold hydrolase [Candidatus Nanopelagicales bacterium]|jgi:2-hydroxymuconate-semialdehyde hydrolase